MSHKMLRPFIVKVSVRLLSSLCYFTFLIIIVIIIEYFKGYVVLYYVNNDIYLIIKTY